MEIGELTTLKNLESFEDRNFRTSYMRMRLMLEGLDLSYVMDEPKPIDDLQNENQELDKERLGLRWDEDDNTCRCLILKGLADWLFDIFHHNEIASALMNSLESVRFDKQGKKRFLSCHMEGQLTVLEHFLEMKHLIRLMVKHGEEMLEERQVKTIYNKLALSWEEFKLQTSMVFMYDEDTLLSKLFYNVFDSRMNICTL